MPGQNIYEKKYAKKLMNREKGKRRPHVDLDFQLCEFDFDFNYYCPSVSNASSYITNSWLFFIEKIKARKSLRGLEPIAFLILRQNFFLVANIFIGSFFKFVVFFYFSFSVIIFPFMGGFISMLPRVRVVVVKSYMQLLIVF